MEKRDSMFPYELHLSIALFLDVIEGTQYLEMAGYTRFSREIKSYLTASTVRCHCMQDVERYRFFFLTECTISGLFLEFSPEPSRWEDVMDTFKNVQGENLSLSCTWQGRGILQTLEWSSRFHNIVVRIFTRPQCFQIFYLDVLLNLFDKNNNGFQHIVLILETEGKPLYIRETFNLSPTDIDEFHIRGTKVPAETLQRLHQKVHRIRVVE